MSINTIHDVITVTIGGGEWTLHSCGARRFGFPPDLAGLTLGRAFIDAARRAMRGPATPITQDVTIDGVRVILTSVEVIATVPGPRVFALAWERVSRPPPVNVAITINGDGAGIGAAFDVWLAEHKPCDGATISRSAKIATLSTDPSAPHPLASAAMQRGHEERAAAVAHAADIVREKLVADGVTILSERIGSRTATFCVEAWGSTWAHRPDVVHYFDRLDVWARERGGRPPVEAWTVPDHGAWAEVTIGAMTPPHVERRTAEAPLVALVAAAPEGLDPVGWRAAVLAVAEARSIGDLSSVFVDGAMSEATKALLGVRDIGSGESRIYPMARLAVAAYRRAVAPQGPRPKVERKIGGRAVRLVLDA